MQEKVAEESRVNKPSKNHTHRLPLWQVEKMKNLIQEQWEEVWRVMMINKNH